MQASEKWRAELSEKVKKFVLKGDYKSAVSVAKKSLKEFPKDLVGRFQYAKLIGDYADELPRAGKKKLKKEAVSILKPLLRSLNGLSIERRSGISINYYYQTEKFKEMYQYGRRFARTDKQRGAYAQGLGAVLHAAELRGKKKLASAKSWARKSVKAWERYDLANEKYYFAHYSYAKALALMGENARARKALEKAAKLSGRKVSDWEFADVMELLK